MSFKFLFVLSFVTLLAPLFIGGQAFAEQVNEVPYETKRMKELPSTNEDVGMAFFNLAGLTPDFEALARLNKDVDAMDDPARTDYMNKEPLRMEQKFTSFSSTSTPLIFRVPLPVRFIPNRDGTSQLKIDFRQGTSTSFYFPFYYSNKPIAVLIQGIEAFETIHLDVNETKVVAGKLGFRPMHTVLLEVYVVKVDAKQSLILDGINQYPLLTKIGYIGIINSSAEQVWAWESESSKRAVSKMAEDIRNLQPIK